MYSRSTHDREYKIPEHYSGTFLREGGVMSGETMRDAVGRPSAIPRGAKKEEVIEGPPKNENIKRSPLAFLEMGSEGSEKEEAEEKKDAHPIPSGTSFGSDELIIAALILLLLSGRDGGEDSALILLILLLFL